jgi:hypothetical protein
MDIKILIATHKQYPMPDNEIYVPLHVGREGKNDLGYLSDNTGDNISAKNPAFCELTGIYWAYKNFDCEIIGLCHYRRYFRSIKHNHENKFDNLLTATEIENIMLGYDIILPKKDFLYFWNIKTHYRDTHHIEDLDLTRKILSEKYPEYLNSFDTVMKQHTIHFYNMFIMKKTDFDRYCSWLFDILFEVENRANIENYTNYQKRIYGFLTERLFNVWIYHNQLRVYKNPVFAMEPLGMDKQVKRVIKRKLTGKEE